MKLMSILLFLNMGITLAAAHTLGSWDRDSKKIKDSLRKRKHAAPAPIKKKLDKREISYYLLFSQRLETFIKENDRFPSRAERAELSGKYVVMNQE